MSDLNAPLGGSQPSRPLSPGELASTMSHYHRAEIGRMAGWRDRLDRTTNWAVTVAAAMLSVSLSTPSSHHGVLLFAMLLILQLLWIEARRYRFFDVYRARVRQFERYYFAQIFSPQDNYASNWLLILGETLRTPRFLISTRAAFSRRLRRNYIHLFSILLLAWVLKLTTPTLQSQRTKTDLATSAQRAIIDASLGPLPGWLVVGLVSVFYGWLVYTAYFQHVQDGELSIGDVHV